MVTNPIIPVWVMSIICIAFAFMILCQRLFWQKLKISKNSQYRKKLIKEYLWNIFLKMAMLVLLFIMNLRIMVPNGENEVLTVDANVLFVIDTSVSMRALDYNGKQERLEGIVQDCCYIVEELSGCRFSILTFGDSAQKLIPFTSDSDMAQAELKAIQLENDFYAKGSSMNLVKDLLEKALKEEKERYEKKDELAKIVVFFITDGEITAEGQELESFEETKKYIAEGAVLGYGTEKGGKMVNSLYQDSPNDENYYISYYDDNYKKQTAISQLNKENLKQIAQDLDIDYIHMQKQSDINSKLKEIKKEMAKAEEKEEKIKAHKDTYYYVAIPFTILLILNFIMQKRKMK